MEPVKITVEMLHLYNNRWLRFVNTDREFLLDDNSAVIYHSPRENESIFRVCSTSSCFDVVTKPDIGKGMLQSLHQRLRKCHIVNAQIYSLSKPFVDFVNMRAKTSPQVRSWLERLNRPHLVAFDKPSRGGLRQIAHLQHVNSKSPMVNRRAWSIDFSILSLTEELYREIEGKGK